MTEQQIKLLCKWSIENSKRSLSKDEKEIIKQTIDSAKSIDDLIAIALLVAGIR